MINALVYVALLGGQSSAGCSMRLVGQDKEGWEFRLDVGGKPTTVTMHSPDRNQPPFIDASRTGSGIVYGSVSVTVDGATLLTQSTAFIQKGSRFWARDDEVIGGRRGNRILLIPTQEAHAAEAHSAFLYDGSRLVDLS